MKLFRGDILTIVEAFLPETLTMYLSSFLSKQLDDFGQAFCPELLTIVEAFRLTDADDVDFQFSRSVDYSISREQVLANIDCSNFRGEVTTIASFSWRNIVDC